MPLQIILLKPCSFQIHRCMYVYISNLTMALHKMWKKEKSMANLMFTTAQCTSANLCGPATCQALVCG